MSSVLPVRNGHAQDTEPPQLRRLIDMPIAGSLARGQIAVETRAFANGGVLGSVTVGLMHRLMVGVHFGGENVIGDGVINWNPNPGISVQFRVIDETFVLPAITIGFSNQGYGPYIQDVDRYAIKPVGFYAVASRNYLLLGNFGLHGGINRSLESSDKDTDLNLFFGINKGILHLVEVMIEYDLAFNDNEKQTLGSNHGYLNAGIRWNVSSTFATEFDFKNLADNRRRNRRVTRILQFTFLHSF